MIYHKSIMVVKPYCVEARHGDSIGYFFRPLAIGIDRLSTEVCSIKADGLSGTVTKFKTPIPDNNRAIFPGRGIKPSGKVQCGTLFYLFFKIQFFPFFA